MAAARPPLQTPAKASTAEILTKKLSLRQPAPKLTAIFTKFRKQPGLGEKKNLLSVTNHKINGDKAFGSEQPFTTRRFTRVSKISARRLLLRVNRSATKRNKAKPRKIDLIYPQKAEFR